MTPDLRQTQNTVILNVKPRFMILGENKPSAGVPVGRTI